MTDSWFEQAFAAHYPLLYQHRDEREAARCLELLPKLAPLGEGHILDLGCGEGRHLQRMRDHGRAVTGLDLSAALLGRARERANAGDRFPLVRGDMRQLPFTEGSFNSVLSLFTAFGYFGPLQQNRPVVAEVARVLAPGGHWFLDYLDADRVRRELEDEPPAPRVRQIGPLDIRETKRLSVAGDRVLKSVSVLPVAGHEGEAAQWQVEPAGLHYEEQVALFTVDELDVLAADEGLDRVAQAGSYEGQDLGTGDRWILVYRRRIT